ncbi:helix-loop-helix protein that binds the motif-containing protein [Coniochaeta ligniaria NRRL 30616]|uniref:Helix-loop-helix protein that binds the motif-containing protein n=1 Tax=Coniochaeta ligniaria NRRL 30616 TaxID=1408157 RepID=A0A1J7J350_9PEZI|nr:helix-loop-helix protein that binds the motif-containing protein [Coniochaeta ligniaria NRRL 30616]
MADSMVAGQPNLSNMPTSPVGKRKRTESASPDSRRSKRGVPTASMAVPDTSAATFQAQAQAQAAHAHPAHVHAAQEHVNVDDFSALQQASVEHNEAADPANASSTAAAALGSMYPTMHIPQPTEETFATQVVPGEAEHHQADSSYTSPMPHDNGLSMAAPTAQMQVPNGVQDNPHRYATTKPAVGSEEWHKQRKDNHKEVERRRRETINEGINELAKIVPGCEKNKGSILQRAVAFITQLKENEQQNIEKWTLEKLLTEQAITELSQSNDKLKSECERLYREVETWKKAAQNAGAQPTQKDEPAASG